MAEVPPDRRVPRISTTPAADAIIGLSSITQSVFARAAERHSLTPAHARLLCILAAGPRGMTELAGLMGVEKAALTGLADRAERRGLLTRSPGSTDRRAITLTLTGTGLDTARAFHRDVSARLSALTEVLSEAEREVFCRSVARMRECGTLTREQTGDTWG